MYAPCTWSIIVVWLRPPSALWGSNLGWASPGHGLVHAGSLPGASLSWAGQRQQFLSERSSGTMQDCAVNWFIIEKFVGEPLRNQLEKFEKHNYYGWLNILYQNCPPWGDPVPAPSNIEGVNNWQDTGRTWLLNTLISLLTRYLEQQPVLWFTFVWKMAASAGWLVSLPSPLW